MVVRFVYLMIGLLPLRLRGGLGALFTVESRGSKRKWTGGTDMAQREIEIDEALAAVEEALDCLDAAARDLKSARNWGLLDMFGGGFWISAFKQGRMQAAQEHLNAA